MFDGQAVEGTLMNLSLGGALVTSSVKYTMGAHVSISFKIPAPEHLIEIGATVRWADSNTGGIGLQFDGLRARDVWALNEFFKRLP